MVIDAAKIPAHVKRLLPVGHLEALDGAEVWFDPKTGIGTVDCYTVDGEEFCLYPVYRGWCKEKELTLF